MKINNLIEISKSEAEKIRKQYPQISITRTMKSDSKRHHYSVAELDKYLKLIQDTNEKAKEILAQHKKYNLKFYQN